MKKSLLRKLAVASFGVLAIAALTAGWGGESKKAPAADGKKTVVKTVISGTEASLIALGEKGEKQGVKLVALAEPVKVNATYVLVNKKEDKLAAEINEALKALRADGTLSKINIKWYKNDLMKLLK